MKCANCGKPVQIGRDGSFHRNGNREGTHIQRYDFTCKDCKQGDQWTTLEREPGSDDEVWL